MFRNRFARPAWLLGMVAVIGAGCSDSRDPAPTAPSAPHPLAAVDVASTRARQRTPYIASVDLSSVYVSISGGSTPYTVTITNPGQKDAPLIYLKGELKSENNQPPVPASAFIAYCPYPNGTVPRGSCTMSDGITGGATLAPGPGTFTLRLLQRQSDDTMKELDSVTTAVILRQF